MRLMGALNEIRMQLHEWTFRNKKILADLIKFVVRENKTI